MRTLYKIALFFALFVFAGSVSAQQTELDNAIELHKQGKIREAIKILEKLSKAKNTKKDANVWNYLGLAYIADDDMKKACKALEKAAGLSPQNSDIKTNLGYALLLSNKINSAQSELNAAIRINPKNFLAFYIRGTSALWEGKYDEALADAEKTIGLQAGFSSAYILKADVFVGKFGRQVATGSTPKSASAFLRQAIETLESCLKVCQNIVDIQQERLESVKAFYQYFNRFEGTGVEFGTPTEISRTQTVQSNRTPLRLTYKPSASYTDSARRAGISGTVTLYVLFGANGKIMHVIPINQIGYGLDASVLKAVRQIRFEPPTENGKPVSVVKMVEYVFTIY